MAEIACSLRVIFHHAGSVHRCEVATRFIAACIPRILELENEDCANFIALAPQGGELYVYGAEATNMVGALLAGGNWPYAFGDAADAPKVDVDALRASIESAAADVAPVANSIPNPSMN